MSQNKTRASEADVLACVDALDDPVQREDSRNLIERMQRFSGQPPVLWGDRIIGFGRYRYRYSSGREGEWPRIGFAPRKGQLVLYLMDGFEDQADLLDRLGKVRTGKSCLYIKRLEQIDLEVLDAMNERSLDVMQSRYPE
ncbi:DUF1801 domain-containing protein [Wenzhouxiangella marina]|uniref:Uncharacterized protein n=1 Tax=Wenzhouxiangella marina TaxID=1579979 RepID=A0A0K0XW52_9GAMM|nr:DUF1801 domain-containing protein [Wenzhouxiangella marina]AKS41857.1 hypothetical protein WM2015_1486 [Wenzhouxiangella marina]MBB6086377.1 hypothetical protein [Wenzhouxiangella marina]